MTAYGYIRTSRRVVAHMAGQAGGNREKVKAEIRPAVRGSGPGLLPLQRVKPGLTSLFPDIILALATVPWHGFGIVPPCKACIKDLRNCRR